MSKLVEIERDITINVQADSYLFIYTLSSWILSLIVTALILTVMGLMNTTLSDALFKLLMFAYIIELLLFVTLIDFIRERLRNDADEIVDSIKKAVTEAEA